MRRVIFTFLMLFIGSAVFGQNYLLYETFDDAGLPEGWSFDSRKENWSVTKTDYAGGSPNEVRLFWSPKFNGDAARLVSPVIDIADKENIVIEFKHFLHNFASSNSIQLQTTSTNGAQWETAWIGTYNKTGTYEIARLIETKDVGSSNFRFSIVFEGNSNNINQWNFDDFKVYQLANKDAAVSKVIIEDYLLPGEHEIGFGFTNKGLTKITSIEASYRVGDQPPVKEIFNGLEVDVLNNLQLEFSNKAYLDPSSHDIKVEILSVNGSADDILANNAFTKTVNVAVKLLDKTVCIEHFTSSTCVPCVKANTSMKTLMENNPGKFSITKYQMSFPSPGDPYYTSEGGVRRQYYMCNAVPMIMFNGKEVSSVTQGNFDAALAEPAYIDINGSYTLEDETVKVHLDVMSYVNIPEARIHVIVNEKRTTGNLLPLSQGGNGEFEFFHVMMKMLPNAQGTITALNSGECFSLDLEGDLSETNIEEFDDLEINVFVQEHKTQKVFNSKFLVEREAHPYPCTHLAIANENNESLKATWEAPEKGSPEGYNVYLNGQLLVEKHQGLSYSIPITDEMLDLQIIEVSAVYPNDVVSVKAVVHLSLCPNNPPVSLGAKLSGKNVVLTWSAPAEGADSYVVYFNNEVLQDNVKATAFTHRDVPEGEHVYGVATNSGKCVSSKTDVKIKVGGTEGIASQERAIKIYPNPTNGAVVIQHELSIKDIRLFDLSGRLVYQEANIGSKEFSLDLSAFSDGIYFIKIFTEADKTSSHKLIIRH